MHEPHHATSSDHKLQSSESQADRSEFGKILLKCWIRQQLNPKTHLNRTWLNERAVTATHPAANTT